MACSLCRQEGHNRSTCSVNPQVVARNLAQAKKYIVGSPSAEPTTKFVVPAWRAPQAGSGSGRLFYAGTCVVLLSSEKLTCIDRTSGHILSTASDVLAAAPTAEGRLLVVNSSRVSWHDVEHPLCFLPGSELVMEAALHATALRLATADGFHSISCFDVRASERVWRTSRLWGALRELSGPREIAFDETGAHLASLARDETLTIRETSQGKVVGKCADVEAFAWHPSGQAVLVHHANPYPGQLRLLNLSLDSQYWRTSIAMSLGGSSLLAFTRDGARLAVAERAVAKIFRTKDGEVLAAEPLPEFARAIALAAWNRRLALATLDLNGDVVQRDLAPR